MAEHDDDLEFLREAIDLAIEKMTAGEGGPFGAIVVKNGQAVGRGWNRVTSTNDPTAHAEIAAIREACSRMQTFSLAGCQIYASCEPCPMCLAAIYWARLESVCFAADSGDAAAAGFDDSHVHSELRKPVLERSIPMRQALPHEGQQPFRLWIHKPDRIEY
jgi:guanine deaminase